MSETDPRYCRRNTREGIVFKCLTKHEGKVFYAWNGLNIKIVYILKKKKKTDTFKYKLQTNKLATVESGGEITELHTCTVDKKQSRFYSLDGEDSGQKPEITGPFRILQLTKVDIEHVRSKRSDQIRGICKINNQVMVFVLDTGADLSALSETAYETLKPQTKLI
ncbi:hypothetical protein BpHYR1_025497 [Brachionus plicatilis]|uniref:Uncharacterized protein n=1 Tax=Brachionus plicatilis TaxID=10195 RepID=A0A3M7PJN8_BRAPC|nr:hypothetical protein BpHYR1_025497 [Brachionus plicatilis]